MTLEELIDNALLDGKLSKNEIEIIVKKAVNEGYDLDEVKIYLNARLHEVRRERWNRIPKATKKTFAIIIANIMFLSAIILVANWDSITSKATAISCGCENVDDCLAKYKFEEARKYASKLDDYKYNDDFFPKKTGENPKADAFFKIICTETDYWINQYDLKRAEASLKELRSLDVSNHNISESDRDEKYLDLTFSIISKYCQKQQFENAKELAYDLPTNQMHYESKYEYPQKDAFKIIEKFKKEK